MAKYIKNNDSVERVWCGQTVQSEAYYLIESSEETKWANDSDVFDSIADDTLIVSSSNNTGGHITDHAQAVNYLKGDILDIDAEGRQVTRQAAAKSGWTILIHNIEMETSNLSGLYSKDYLGNDSNGLSTKFYDVNNAELTTQGSIDTDCVRTELIFKPNYDYEILGGNVFHVEEPATDVRLWCIGGMLEGGAAYVKEMIRGINFRYIAVGDHIKVDGRTTKYMRKDTVGAPYQTNQLKFIVKHNAGLKFKISIAIEYFRE